ncbi:MAG: 30S ribosome-binding factor RbfA [Phycisphaerales bacterium]|nr:30S ribosome-binding factor RbfA [Phycisphaerales bacterium]
MASFREQDPSKEDRVRPRQVASLLARVLQDRLTKGLADPRFRGLVSVTDVGVSADLRSAVVKVSVLPAKYGPRVLHALASARGVFRSQIRSETSLRRIPELEFRLDDSLKRDAELAAAIREGRTDDAGTASLDREGPDPEADGITEPSVRPTDRVSEAGQPDEDLT